MQWWWGGIGFFDRLRMEGGPLVEYAAQGTWGVGMPAIMPRGERRGAKGSGGVAGGRRRWAGSDRLKACPT